MVHFPLEVSERINTGIMVGDEPQFVRDNMEYMGSSEHVTGFRRKWPEQTEYFGVYKCRLLTKDNLCSIHDNKPRVCSDYPWYGCKKK
jgi:Fe-S-cluster containining protein